MVLLVCNMQLKSAFVRGSNRICFHCHHMATFGRRMVAVTAALGSSSLHRQSPILYLLDTETSCYGSSALTAECWQGFCCKRLSSVCKIPASTFHSMQGLPLTLSGVRKIMTMMDWGDIGEFVTFGEVGHDQIDDASYYILVAPQNAVGNTILTNLGEMVRCIIGCAACMQSAVSPRNNADNSCIGDIILPAICPVYCVLPLPKPHIRNL